MALPPLTNNVTREQLGADTPNWFVKFLIPFNDFMTKTAYALRRNLTFSENIACRVRNLTFSTNDKYSTGVFQPIQFTSDLNTKVFGVTIEQLNRTKGGTGFDSPSNPIWSENSGVITVSYIGGLQNSASYSITLLMK